MRKFASEKVARLMDRMGFKDGEVLEHSLITRSIENAQKKVEENNFGIRKHLLDYDDVMNKQRTVIYEKRRHALMGERIGMDIANMIWERCVNATQLATYDDCKMEVLKTFALETPFNEDDFMNKNKEDLAGMIFDSAMLHFKQRTDHMAEIAYPVIKQVYETQGQMYENILIPITDGRKVYNISCNLKEAYETECKTIVKQFEKSILLHVIDEEWKENLRSLDELRNSVQNARYEQKDPLVLYKLDSAKLFDDMVEVINNDTISILMRGQIPLQEPQQVQQAAPERRQDMSQLRENKRDAETVSGGDPAQQAAAAHDTREQQRTPYVAPKTVGRNDPCPCGSGKKFKNCHGKGL